MSVKFSCNETVIASGSMPNLGKDTADGKYLPEANKHQISVVGSGSALITAQIGTLSSLVTIGNYTTGRYMVEIYDVKYFSISETMGAQVEVNITSVSTD